MRGNLERAAYCYTALLFRSRCEAREPDHVADRVDVLGGGLVVGVGFQTAARVGLEPRVASIRGGTDGSRLSEKGLPTPNIYAGGNEFHSVREWISVQDLALSAATVVELLKVWAEPEWAARARPA